MTSTLTDAQWDSIRRDSRFRESDLLGERRLTARRLGGWPIAAAVAGLFLWAGQAAAQTAPKVISVSVDGSPSNGETYGFGERIDVLVYFDQAVRVDGGTPPQVALQIGGETRYASYWYYGPYVHFAYIVTAEDRDTDGISIPANALTSNGPSILLASDTSVAADLSHEAVAADPNHKVDGGIVSVPIVENVFFQSSSQRGDTYGLGETIEVGVHFDKAVTVTGDPVIGIRVGTETRVSTSWFHGRQYGSLGSKITFYYTVQAEDLDSDGVRIPANALSVSGGSIALEDHPDVPADLSHEAVADDPDHKVDGSLGPRVTGVSFLGSPDSGDTYGLGEPIQVLVEFDESVTLDQRVRLGVAIGTRTRQARGTSLRGESLTFEYLVQAADLDGDGTSIPSDAFTLNGASVNADLGHEAVAPDPGRKVDGSIAVAPKIASISFGSRPRRAGDGNGFPVYGDTYGLGEAIGVSVNFDKPVRATGNVQVGLDIGESVRQASYAGNSSFSFYRSISFDYVVQPGDADSDGISIAANALTLNGGAISHARRHASHSPPN